MAVPAVAIQNYIHAVCFEGQGFVGMASPRGSYGFGEWRFQPAQLQAVVMIEEKSDLQHSWIGFWGFRLFASGMSQAWSSLKLAGAAAVGGGSVG